MRDGCAGFTFYAPGTPAPTQETWMYFKDTKGNPVANSDWHSYLKRRPMTPGNTEVWYGPVQGGALAVILLNRNNITETVVAHWVDLGLDVATPMLVRDLWAHTNLGYLSGSYSAKVPVHGCVMITLSPFKQDVMQRDTESIVLHDRNSFSKSWT